MSNLLLLKPKFVNAEVERRKKLAELGWALMGFAGLVIVAWILVHGWAQQIDSGF